MNAAALLAFRPWHFIRGWAGQTGLNASQKTRMSHRCRKRNNSSARSLHRLGYPDGSTGLHAPLNASWFTIHCFAPNLRPACGKPGQFCQCNQPWQNLKFPTVIFWSLCCHLPIVTLFINYISLVLSNKGMNYQGCYILWPALPYMVRGPFLTTTTSSPHVLGDFASRPVVTCLAKTCRRQ